MAEENVINIIDLDDAQKQIFVKLAANDKDGFKQLIAQVKGGVNFIDENGITPLQHACCKGNKEAVQILLDMGADIDFSEHGANYTPLHFAALSGNTDICTMLLDAGINPNTLNTVNRTASQMAAFVGNHACVETINNYVSKSQLEYYTKPQGLQKDPLILPVLINEFHKLVVDINLHPVRIVLNLQNLGLLKHLHGLRKALELMCEKEMKKQSDINEVMALKYHYQRWIIGELIRCEEQFRAQRKEKPATNVDEPNRHDFVEMFIKRVLKENKFGQFEYIQYLIRDCVREFPFRECTIFRQVITQLSAKDAPPAMTILRSAINGQRGFVEEISCCSSCGNEKPDKKCSKCKAVQYCDRECQRLHWFMHKKTCNRPTSNATNTPLKGSIDANELRQEFSRMTASEIQL